MWYFYALLAAIFAAFVAIFGKLGLKEIDSTLATTFRSIIMAGFLIAISLTLGKFNNFNYSSLSTKDWTFITLSGICGALSWLFYFLALKQGITSSVSAIDKLSIVITIVLAFLFLGEALSWKVAIGAVLMTVGAIMISFK